MLDRKTLRREMRARRRALTPQQQRQAGKRLAKQISRQLWFIKAHHVALYLPNDGEIDTTPLIELCRTRHKTLYLPVLHPIRHNRLWFTPYTSTTRMQYNRYRILEPVLQAKPLRPAVALDLVLLPLVAFSANGGRMGMGGGYYDRTFAFRLENKGMSGPKLVGLAHELQKVDQLPIETWDVPLDAIASDARIYTVSC